MTKFGIDISKWQGDFSIGQAMLTEGVEFVIAKCGGSDKGVYKDKQFEANYAKAKEAGCPIGVYWFSKAMSVEEAQRDADYCLNLIRGKQFELPIYIDVENKEQLAVGRDKLTSIIDAFLSRIEQQGYYVGIYSSESYFRTYMDDNYLQKYTHWVAKWSTKSPSVKCDMWQFGGETNKIRSNKINGQTVDQDYMLKDFPNIIRNAGLNGFKKPLVNGDDRIKEQLILILNMGYNKDDILRVLDNI